MHGPINIRHTLLLGILTSRSISMQLPGTLSRKIILRNAFSLLPCTTRVHCWWFPKLEEVVTSCYVTAQRPVWLKSSWHSVAVKTFVNFQFQNPLLRISKLILNAKTFLLLFFPPFSKPLPQSGFNTSVVPAKTFCSLVVNILYVSLWLPLLSALCLIKCV